MTFTIIEDPVKWDALAAAVEAYKEVVNTDYDEETVGAHHEELVAATRKVETTFKSVIRVDVFGCVTWTEEDHDYTGRVKVFIDSPTGDVLMRLELLVSKLDAVLHSQKTTITRRTGVEEVHRVTVIF